MLHSNPTSDRWPCDCEPGDPGGAKEIAGQATEAAYEKIPERLSGGRGKRRAAVVLLEEHLPFGSPPRPARVTDPYARPFRRREAARLLTSAGISHEGVVAAYVAAGAGVPGRAQCVVARVRAVDGPGTRNVHFYFAWDREKEGWRLCKAAVEVNHP
jgi:hypothetical protein